MLNKKNLSMDLELVRAFAHLNSVGTAHPISIVRKGIFDAHEGKRATPNSSDAYKEGHDIYELVNANPTQIKLAKKITHLS